MSVARSLRHTEAVYPGLRLGELAVPGPDEDLFTLRVEALERWADRRGPERAEPRALHWVGPVLEGSDGLVLEALGWAGTETHAHPAGAVGLWRALLAAQGAPDSERPDLVVAVDAAPGASGSPPAWGAGAVLLEVGPGPGARLGQVRSVARRPGQGSPSYRGLLGHGPAGTVAWHGARALSVADHARWAEATADAGGQLLALADPPWCGPAPTLGASMALVRLAAGLSSGGRGVLIEESPTRADSVELAVDPAPGQLAEPPRPPAGHPLRREEWSAQIQRLDRVSEGAYVPRPRYLEALASRWRFVADECGACGQITFPQRGCCRRCRRADLLTARALARSGLPVLAATWVVPGAQPTEFDSDQGHSPGYGVVMVELARGVRATLQVSGAAGAAVPLGEKVDTRLRRLYPMEGEWRYGRKAVVPAPEDGAASPAGGVGAEAVGGPKGASSHDS